MQNFYRPDIDGLRAISILGVVFFHFKFDFFSGGYLGVDVFIVISGYLITSFIFDRLKSKKFYLKEFIIRRAKRLLPTFFIVLFLCLLFAFFTFLPVELTRFSKSAISTAFLSSNFFFWLHSGYWDESNTNPLLHTWSLSLEWQFYFFISLLSILLWSFSKKKISILLYLIFFIIFLISFVLAIIFLDRSVSFFLLPFRIYEFLIGTFVYFVVDKKIKIINKNKNILSIFAILLIIYSFFAFDSNSNVPGYIALLPCLGTALLIYLSNSIIHKFLKNKILVYLGLISYSLYLYHWPVLIFYSWLNIIEINFITKLILIIFSVGLSSLNYHFLEKPVRFNPRVNLILRYFFISFLLLVIFLSSIIIINKGYPERFSEQKKNLLNSLKDDVQIYRKNYLRKNIDLKFDDNKKRVLVIGDSNGVDMFMAINQNISEDIYDVEFIKFSAWCFKKSKVLSLLSFFEKVKKRNIICEREEELYDKNKKLLADANYIVFSSSWHKGIHLYLDDVINHIRLYSKAKLIISSKTTNFPNISTLVQRIDENDFINLNKIAYQVKLQYINEINQKLKEKVNSLNLQYLDKSKLICSQKKKTCSIYNKNKNEFHIIDAHHWTLQGAKFFGEKIDYNNLFK
jgi:peptidoglycan/LPS O-acetylase OafA/YrhL